MKKLEKSDLSTVDISVDDLGKVFFYKNRILRAIKNDSVKKIHRMFEIGFINEIVNANLFPNTWITEFEIEGYSLVIEHEKIPYWSYPYEWSFDMLKDAGELVLKINKISNNYGYQIMDGHAFNVTFHMNKPIYIDLGSFVNIEKNNKTAWPSYTSFYNHFYIPLYLWSKGYPDTARNIFLMRDYFSENEFLKIKYPILANRYTLGIYKNIKILSLTSNYKIIKKINNKYKKNIALLVKRLFSNIFTVENINNSFMKLKTPNEKSLWNNYHDDINPNNDARFIRIAKIIDTLSDAKSLLEVASNQGKFSAFLLDNSHINEVIATDYDNSALNTMYMKNKKRNNFHTLLFDFVRTNGRKYDDDYINNRIKSDIVMALAVTHHLILTQGIPVDYIFSTLRNLTNKYIIIEFMPMGLYSGEAGMTPDLPKFYNLNWFKEKFIKYFDLILDEKLEKNRHVFVGKITINNN